jgi:succinate dehydrogenase/fumarate reductase flavoprotein subunit
MHRTVPLAEVPRFDLETDVLVCGFGGAGACATLEARAAGAEVILLERSSGGGGSTALSACEMYLGGSGGTRLQRELGIEDSSANFRAYLEECFGPFNDPARLDVFVAGAAAHFDWIESLGVRYKRELYPEREVVCLTGASLQYTGNERAWPFPSRSQPVPRGHLPADAGHDGGKVLMGVVMQRVAECGADIRLDTRVTALVQDESGAVCGAIARSAGEEIRIRARRGVVLTTGGFIMNETMTRQHIPQLDSFCTRHGNPGDQGDGILLGVVAGGHAIHMGQAFISVAHYPPAITTFGIFVNAQGQRFVNEDVYLARIGHYASVQNGMRFFMFTDEPHFARPDYHQTTEIVAVGETVAEVEREAGLPEGALQQTVDYYNAHAARGEDPLFHKAREWLAPLTKPPFALIDYSLPTLKPHVFTLGGLDTLPTGEVLTPDRTVIPGLYAAGRTACGIPRTCQGYASGMSVADATFFGRLAGRSAAGRMVSP